MKLDTRILKSRIYYFFVFIVLTTGLSAQKKETIVIEELQHLSDISLLPMYRQNSKVAMVSSYDTSGGNDDGFSGKYSFIRKEGENRFVMADLKGPGVIQRIWTPTPTANIIEFYFDGEKTPRISMKFEDLFSSKVFPFKAPLVGNEVGGYYSYVPIPYKKSCKIVYVGDGLKFHQIQYRTYHDKKKISTFSMAWTEEEKKAFKRVSNVWANSKKHVSNLKQEIEVIKRKVYINPGEKISLAEIQNGGRIVGMTFNNGSQLEGEHTDLIFRSTWDDDKAYAINVPMASLFGYAFGKRAMNSMLMGSNGETNYCYLPMPFDKRAVLELEYLKRGKEFQPSLSFQMTLYYTKEKRKSRKEGKLYTVWNREIPKKGRPYNIIKQQGKGHHVGTILLCQSIEKETSFTTGFFEGDDVTIIDGDMRMHGTGSEDYFNGGWYGVADRWDDGFSLPLHGCLDYSIPLARTGGYRFYLGDKVNFSEDYELTIEHGPENNQWQVDYASIAFYYGDTPVLNAINPSLETTKGFDAPEKLEVYLNFFNIQSLGFPYAPVSVNYKKIKEKEVFLFHSEEDWISVKTSLNLPVSDGTYKLYMSYFKSSNSNQLRLFQRQRPISEWVDVSSDKTEFIEQQFMGNIKVANGEAFLTFKTKGKSGKCDFALYRIYLIKN
ncbi:glycoside hydrolase family 172 protein [Flavivirga spongiicola]|uniref:DUF2961 domain-containing protein n=1 Tax=Flavivirga spongiicola TaxID=421621 RepID=A0ABU7XPC5_9FLAO|nr:glycoside hydrolase family 172 protein [Flavivirga sp. MEBiC05379]MDO5977396.1 DUF2961 domain-containing protein [Flavivirga sp. MEBiC05379]